METIDMLTWAIGILTMLGVTGFGFIWKHFNYRLDKIDDRFDKVDDRFDKVDDRFDKMEEKFDRLSKEFADIKMMLFYTHGYMVKGEEEKRKKEQV